MPFALETELTAKGATFRKAANWTRNVVVSDRLVTGQNPASAAGVGEAAAVLSATLLLPACRSVGSRPNSMVAEPAPYDRFFRGVVRADLSRMSPTFVSALPAAYADKGASAYLPAVPPTFKPVGIADEFALIAWDSEKACTVARETPEGRGHAELHWTLFDREHSRSGAAIPLATELAAEPFAGKIASGQAVNVRFERKGHHD